MTSVAVKKLRYLNQESIRTEGVIVRPLSRHCEPRFLYSPCWTRMCLTIQSHKMVWWLYNHCSWGGNATVKTEVRLVLSKFPRSSFWSAVYSYCGLLRCDTAWSVRSLPTFRKNALPACSVSNSKSRKQPAINKQHWSVCRLRNDEWSAQPLEAQAWNIRLFIKRCFTC
jgi:hypothetical protein